VRHRGRREQPFDRPVGRARLRQQRLQGGWCCTRLELNVGDDACHLLDVLAEGLDCPRARLTIKPHSGGKATAILKSARPGKAMRSATGPLGGLPGVVNDRVRSSKTAGGCGGPRRGEGRRTCRPSRSESRPDHRSIRRWPPARVRYSGSFVSVSPLDSPVPGNGRRGRIAWFVEEHMADAGGGAARGWSGRRRSPGGAGTLGMGDRPPRSRTAYHRGAGAQERRALDDGDPRVRPSQAQAILIPTRHRMQGSVGRTLSDGPSTTRR